MTSLLRQEFEKAYLDAWRGEQISRFSSKSGPAIALWAAKWTAKKLAQKAAGHQYVRNRPVMDPYEIDHNNLCEVFAEDCHQLSKELDQ